jgi:hypothetical protein
MVYGRKILPKKHCKCMAGNERKRDVQEFKVKVVLDSLRTATSSLYNLLVAAIAVYM